MSNTPSFGPGNLLAARFADNCVLFPQHPALFIRNEFFTYEQLLEKAEIIFAQLFLESVPAFIGIYTQESVWSYAAILAISLIGSCYVPLNSKFPAYKLQNIIQASGLQLILTEDKLLFAHEAKELILDTRSTLRKKGLPLVQQDLAYLLFTSGSTGQPKGVPVSKKNCAHFFEHCFKNYDFKETDGFLQPYELSFDVSVFSMFAAWNVGACVYCVSDEGIKYLNVVSMLKNHRITVSSLVPTTLLYLEKYMDELTFPHLRYSFFSGDKLYHRMAVKWQKAAPASVLHNCYGPTETTIVCTGYPWEEQRSAAESVNDVVPLGKAFEGMYFLLVGENDRAVSQGIGELCFTGNQVIPAYLNNQDEDRFFEHDGNRYYKTGDLAEVNAQGNLIFHGRKDTQVKINGYRIELGEVEHALYQLTKKPVIVLALEKSHVNELVAFIETEQLDDWPLKKELATILPMYMVPTKYLAVPSFPKNSNGKVDYLQLRNSL